MTMYQHYKGGIYEVLFIATHSETGEKLVIYKNQKDETYARPYDMFFENVVINGVTVPRFKQIPL
ncbi:DUF1653 domain-containing protein [Paenibacillus xylaniclasticus]|uniref:DUF1653 domain-containing protein n=1 Tax=Paenibacillus xylaniclasticus TaxID=588083 RepID=UPI000FDA0587|nr:MULTISPECIES: DUF1653 domain-containing protein [Paenibacillus]GFN31342.1 hypothetical protein PCURB6_16020 [Paenibacillus curdlanolyticus]